LDELPARFRDDGYQTLFLVSSSPLWWRRRLRVGQFYFTHTHSPPSDRSTLSNNQLGGGLPLEWGARPPHLLIAMCAQHEPPPFHFSGFPLSSLDLSSLSLSTSHSHSASQYLSLISPIHPPSPILSSTSSSHSPHIFLSSTSQPSSHPPLLYSQFFLCPLFSVPPLIPSPRSHILISSPHATAT